MNYTNKELLINWIEGKLRKLDNEELQSVLSHIDLMLSQKDAREKKTGE